MDLTKDEAIEILWKWQAEASYIHFTMEAPGQVFAVAGEGTIAELSEELVGISEGGKPRLRLLLKDLNFGYVDAREAPPHAKQWAEQNIEGCLLINPAIGSWACSLFEMKR